MQDMTWSVTDTRTGPMATITRVTYPSGETRASGTVVAVARLTGADNTAALALVLDSTAAHPRSPTWPDQPADRGVLRAPAGREHPLLDVRQGVIINGELMLDATAARAGGVEVVVHLVPPADIEIGDVVEVLVDADFRRALSLAHSACHLASFALDAAVAPLWNKPVQRMDALGHPAFDPLAIQSSTMSPYRTVDVYRLGKSLRKKGFDVARLHADLPAVTRQLRSQLSRWVAADSALSLDAGDGTLSARRSWSCRLDGIDVVMACGGTHPTSAGELAGIDSTLELSPEGDELRMTTTVPRP